MLLDTHAWLWHVLGNATRVAAKARRRIDAARSQGGLIVSVASIFEIASLVSSGRLHLTSSVDAWVRQALESGRMQVADVTAAIALDAGSIPTASLPDPVDRMLVATARTLGVPLATRDTRIIDFVHASGAGRVLDISN